MRNPNYLVLLFLVLFIQCDKSDPVKNPSIDFVTYEGSGGVIGSGGGEIIVKNNIKLDGVSLYVPKGALSSNTEISISENTSVIAPTDSNAVIVSFRPEGLTFNTPVSITLPYSGEKTPTVFCYNSQEDDLVVMPVLEYDLMNGNVKTETMHFSDLYTSEGSVYAEVKMYFINDKIKASIQFGGSSPIKYYIAGIRLRIAPLIWGEESYWNVLSFLTYAVSDNENIYATIEVNLRKKNFIGSTLVESKAVAIKRNGTSQGEYSAEILFKNSSGNFVSAYKSPILDKAGIDLIFSGDPAIINFNSDISSNDQYFIETSFVVSDNINGSGTPPGYRFSPKYTCITKDNKKKGLWYKSDMLTEDPDTDSDGLSDFFEAHWPN